ncbi:hypothetical protein QTJ16_004261 [Diplocarpon rosae]|uniref:DUF7704 domain-containing protein n=1 Tax=Diplocarpon rosae TaxID=946125 RepID=A0AAD9WEH9_9HELO|nr:hypothetical protein QTJ16_004261 [Diplocarpon rosae]
MPPSQLTHISLLYRLYFLCFEPIGALAGTYLCLFDPQRFLAGTVPLPAYLASSSSSSPVTKSWPPQEVGIPGPRTVDLSPLLRMALTNIASLYVLFAVNEGLLLRLTREKRVWCTVIVAMVCADVGHIYAAWAISPERLAAGKLGSWTSDEWINYGTLFAGLGLRIAFLLGFGRR